MSKDFFVEDTELFITYVENVIRINANSKKYVSPWGGLRSVGFVDFYRREDLTLEDTLAIETINKLAVATGSNETTRFFKWIKCGGRNNIPRNGGIAKFEPIWTMSFNTYIGTDTKFIFEYSKRREQWVECDKDMILYNFDPDTIYTSAKMYINNVDPIDKDNYTVLGWNTFIRFNSINSS